MQIFEQVFSEKLQKSFGGRSLQSYDHAIVYKFDMSMSDGSTTYLYSLRPS